jgi:hydrogenase nickel incorporation protein HypA/HybF
VHEISYCEGVVEAVERRAGGRPVARIGIRVGSLHRIVDDAFEQSFQLVAAGGPAEGATTEVVTVPADGVCADCRTSFESFEPAYACPSCGSLAVSFSGGDDLVLEWIEYADAPGPEAGGSDTLHELVPEHSHETTG